MKKSILAFVFLISFFSCKTEPVEGITVVSPEEMQVLLDLENVQFIDVRTAEEYKSGHLKNAQNIDFKSPTFENDILHLDKNKPVVLYCQRGGRSAKCAKKMKAAGFTKIYDLDDGYSQWQSETLNLNLE